MANSENITSTRGVYPLFAKHKDLGLPEGEKLTVYQFCREIEKTVKREDIEGAQRVRGLWRIYLNNNGARAKLHSQGMSMRGKAITLYEQNPFLSREENDDPDRRHVKVTVQNLPLSVSNKEIVLMIKRLGGKIEKDVDYEYERDENDHLTSIKNGNRHLLVNEDIKKNPLPRNTYCGNFRCRIFHYGQKKPEKHCYHCLQEGHFKYQCKNERACRACKKPGHKEGTSFCEYYRPNDCEPFQGKSDELSNFYACNMAWQNADMHCSEMAYGYEMSIMHERADITSEIMRTSEAREVKDLTKKIVKHPKWAEDCDANH